MTDTKEPIFDEHGWCDDIDSFNHDCAVWIIANVKGKGVRPVCCKEYKFFRMGDDPRYYNEVDKEDILEWMYLPKANKRKSSIEIINDLVEGKVFVSYSPDLSGDDLCKTFMQFDRENNKILICSNEYDYKKGNWDCYTALDKLEEYKLQMIDELPERFYTEEEINKILGMDHE